MLTKPRSKKQKLDEFRKCRKDYKYFLKTYAKIRHVERGLIPFSTWDFQDDLLDKFFSNKLNIINKSRQLGISTVVAGYIAWLMIHYQARNIYITSIRIDTAKIMLEMVRTIITNLPDWYFEFFTTKDDNKQTLSLSNTSMLQVGPAGNASRGQALSMMVIDEAAFIDGLDKFWAALQPTVAAGGKCIVLSCVTKDTFVYTKQGIQQVEDFIKPEKEKGYEISKYQVFGKDKMREGELFFNNGLAETRKIITRYAELEGSLVHKVWAFSQGKYGWKELKELSVGNYVSIQKGMECWGNQDEVSFEPKITTKQKNIFSCKKITEDLSYVLGLFLAEGSTSKVRKENNDLIGGNITFTCGDDIERSLEKIGLLVSSHDDLHYTISSKSFLMFLEHLGFDLSLKTKEKRIPKRLLKMSRENIIALLQGIFDSDGWSRKDKGTIGIGLSSLEMIKQIQAILLNFGILSTIKKYTTQPTEKVKVSSVQYRLELNQYNSKLFYNKIGFRLGRKQINENIVSNAKEANNLDVLPNGKAIAQELLSYYKKGASHLAQNHKIYLSSVLFGKKQNINRINLLKLFELVKDDLPKNYKIEIEKILSHNLVWVPIKNIEKGQQEVYDFSLPNNEDDFWAHSVLYNGILGHQTPNGTGNWFERTFHAALAGENSFVATELPWWNHPERDKKWEEETRKTTNKREFSQEYACDFMGSGDTFIDPETIVYYEQMNKSPINIIGYDRKIFIYEECDDSIPNNHIIVVDPAQGGKEDGDPFAFHAVRLSDMTQCAEGQTFLDAESVAKDVIELARLYDDAMIVVENNGGFGIRFLEKIIEMSYTNIYCSLKGTGEYVEYEFLESESSAVMGLNTSVQTRVKMMDLLNEFLEKKKCFIYSRRFTKEMRSFIWKNAKPQARKGKHDDLMMSWAFACFVKQYISGNFEDNEKLMLNALNAPKVSVNYLDTTIPGMPGYSAHRRLAKESQKEKKLQKQFKWLYMG